MSDPNKPTVLITGGGGFLGKALLRELLKPDALLSPREIRVLDLDPRGAPQERVTRLKGDVRRREDLSRACAGVDVVFHLAALIDWGQQDPAEVRAVNLDGTLNVIEACREAGVRALVHTSSLDAIFPGRDVRDADESFPYPEQLANEYCASKAAAERAVIEANGTSLVDREGRLLSIVLRPCAIWGEGDPYHIGSFLKLARFAPVFRIGRGRAPYQFVYVGNIAHALVLAAQALLRGRSEAAGQVYFIKDFPPRNIFDQMEPFVRAAGGRMLPPVLALPQRPLAAVAGVVERVARALRPIWRFTLLFTPFSVDSACVEFTVKTDKAERLLGYQPIYSEVEAQARTIAHVRSLTGRGALEAERFDVVVVGFGAAGACAAIEAADAGARVLVLDRFEGGGSSRRSGGLIYAGGGTETQLAAGFSDDPERMLRYLEAETGGAVSEEVLRAFCDESRTNLRWLSGHGLDFSGGFFAHKTTHPPSGYALYFSGNEQQRAGATSAPRGHVPAAVGMSGGVLFEALQRAARGRGVEVRTRSRATRLLTEAGAVVGVEVLALRDHPLLGASHRLLCGLATLCRPLTPALRRFEQAAGRSSRIRAGAVVIAAGGFAFNRELVKRHAPPFASCMPLGTPGDDGSSLELGQGAGAALTRMEECAAWRFIYPPEAFVSGLLVNLGGERFCDESLYGATLSRQIAEQPDARALLIIDAGIERLVLEELAREERIRDYPLRRIVTGELNALIFRKYSAILNLRLNRHRAGSLAALERRSGLPEGSLQSTVESYNQRIVRGEPDEHGKADRYRLPLREPPYRAINCDLANRLFLGPCITLGGLQTDGLTARVLREDGSAVPGLFAAGRSAAGICAGGYVSGLSLADCIFSGRRAGRGAAERGRVPGPVGDV